MDQGNLTYEGWKARISQITGRIFVGEVAVRAYHLYLKELGIDTVISLLTKEQDSRYDDLYPVDPSLKHFNFHMDDHDVLTPWMIDSILKAFSEKGTLVHCVSGSNRSTAVTICKLIDLGHSPILAFNMYYSSRGVTLARIYQDVPKMSVQMVANIERWIDFHA